MAEEIKDGAEEIKEGAGEETGEKTKEEPKMEPVIIKKPLEKMTAIELKEMAMTIPGATGVSAMKKDDLVTLIREHMVIEEQFTTDERKKKVKKPTASIKELKTKVVQLRGEKTAAQEAKDKGKVDVLRRRINRLKKQTRKVAQVK
jgi:hypothetical protein